jgi:two-component system response regulator FixJ
MSSARSVLVVDDDEQVRESIGVLLATANMKVRAFASAEEFLDARIPEHPLCLLLDVRLPGMSGLELLKRLFQSGAHATVIIITGHGDVPMAVTAMRNGAFHFIEKPFDSEVLIDVVEEALAHAVRWAHENAGIEEVTESFQSLTPREKEVLEFLVEGHPSKVIAFKLGISTRTAEHHRAAVMKKMKARTLSHLVRMRLSLS